MSLRLNSMGKKTRINGLMMRHAPNNSIQKDNYTAPVTLLLDHGPADAVIPISKFSSHIDYINKDNEVIQDFKNSDAHEEYIDLEHSQKQINQSSNNSHKTVK